MKVLKDWQEADVSRWTEAMLSGESKSVFIAWEQSLGKTLATVELSKRLGVETMLVVGPLNTRRSWFETVDEQYESTMPMFYLANDKTNVLNFTFLKNGARGFYFIGWELMRRGSVYGTTVDFAVADETHRQQNRGSDSHNAIKGIKAEYRAALSGTPAGDYPDGIFATIHWLWEQRYKSHQRWVDTMWRVRRNGAVVDFVREVTPGGVIADLPLFSRRLKRDHRTDMPARMPEKIIDVELTPAQRKLYDQFKNASAAWLGDHFVPTALPLEQDLRLTQLALGVASVDDEGKIGFAPDAKSSKIDMLLDVIKGLDKDETVLVLVPSARFIPTVVHQLEKKKITAAGFSGELTPANSQKRDDVIDGFGTKHRVLVASIAAIGEGTDGLQYKCHNEFWLGKHPRQVLNKQAAERLDRPGQTEPVQRWFTVARDTVDENRIDKLEEKQADLDDLLDNHRGAVIE